MAIRVYKKIIYSPKKRLIFLFSYFSLIIGSLLLFWSLYPVISFEIYSKIFLEDKAKSPIVNKQSPEPLENAQSVLGSFNIFSNNLKDYTNVSLWFPAITYNDNEFSQLMSSSAKEYYLSIPKINIKEAKVIINGDDLEKGLIHYLPKTLPGEYGNVVIFGHSTLPQLYNPKDYKTIFTYLPSLEKGDLIKVKIGDLEYTYEVFEMFIVNPEQIWVLDQQKDNAYLTLITCVPPGTYLKRLVVKAKIKLI